jgi:hypothetical protein
MNVKLYPLSRGLASYILPKSIFTRPGSGGSFSSKYCYSVWLRHLHYLISNKLIVNVSDLKNIAEIGPGDSLGIGIAALFTGATNYYGFDVIEHANEEVNSKVANELFELFKLKTTIPNGAGFQNVNPVLQDYSFPNHLINSNSEYLSDRLTAIQASLKGDQNEVSIKYIVSWTNNPNQGIQDIDLIFSQAVMEHVADINFAYKEMYKWLRLGGIVSHQVDFKTHEMTKEWNGHWFIEKNTWAVLAHGRKYPMNRLPLSAHVESIKNAGFVIKAIVPVSRPNTFGTQVPKVNGVVFKENDLTTSSALIQAVKL